MKLEELAEILGAEFRGDPDTEIKGVNGLAHAGEGDVTFLAGRKHLKAAMASNASCLLVSEFKDDVNATQIKVPDPHLSFAELLGRFHPRRRPSSGIDAGAFIDKGAELGEGVSIGAGAIVSDDSSIGARTIIYPGAYIGFGVVIGEDSIIYPNVSILDNVTIGNRVVVHAGTVIGSDGFGYIQRDGSHVKVPQVGSVRVEDDVEIGACVTIDRATTGVTVIGSGTKLDNLIQIAHNVTVGKNVAIAAQSGVAGSSTVGDNVMAGGRVALSDHVEVEAGSILAGRTSVHNNLKRGIYAGTPAIPHRDFLRSAPLVGKLPELFKRLKELERKLEDKEAGGEQC